MQALILTVKELPLADPKKLKNIKNNILSGTKAVFDGVGKFVRVRNPAKNSALHLDLFDCRFIIFLVSCSRTVFEEYTPCLLYTSDAADE